MNEADGKNLRLRNPPIFYVETEFFIGSKYTTLLDLLLQAMVSFVRTIIMHLGNWKQRTFPYCSKLPGSRPILLPCSISASIASSECRIVSFYSPYLFFFIDFLNLYLFPLLDSNFLLLITFNLNKRIKLRMFHKIQIHINVRLQHPHALHLIISPAISMYVFTKKYCAWLTLTTDPYDPMSVRPGGSSQEIYLKSAHFSLGSICIWCTAFTCF